MYVSDFSTELQMTEVSVASIDSTTDVLQAVLEILKQTKGNTCGGVSFRHSYRWVDWAAPTFLKATLLKTFFLIVFQNFYNTSFSNILLKMYEEILLEVFS